MIQVKRCARLIGCESCGSKQDLSFIIVKNPNDLPNSVIVQWVLCHTCIREIGNKQDQMRTGELREYERKETIK